MSDSILVIDAMHVRITLRMDYIIGWLENKEINYIEIYSDKGEVFSFAVDSVAESHDIDLSDTYIIDRNGFADLLTALKTDVLAIMRQEMR
jgi:hypothetical protein